MSILRSFAQLFTLSLLAMTSVTAQPVPTKLPDSVHLFPAGARRGTSVNVRIGVEQTPPHASFFIRGDGVTGDSELSEEVFDIGQPSPRRAPQEVPMHYPRQWAGTVAVAGDAPLGAAYWDTSCASGGSTGCLPFLIGDLPEFVESESNSSPERAEKISLPVTVNGQIHGERDLDYFRFELQAGEVVYCEVLARRLGSRLEPAVAILDESGRAVAWQEDHPGDDPLLSFRAEAAGSYLLQVGNVSFHGSPAHVYRVNLTRKPVTPYVLPVGAPAGRATTFCFYAMSGDGRVRTIQRTLTLTGSDGSVYEHVDDELAHPVPLRVLPASAAVRTRPAGHTEPLEIKVGERINARFSANTTHRYRLKIAESQPLEVRVVAPNSASSLALVQLEISGIDDGRTIHLSKPAPTADDVRARYFWKKPPVGDCMIGVRSIGDIRAPHRSGGYLLEVLPAVADFQLAAGSDCLSVTQGATLEIPVTAERLGGFEGEIALRVDRLPDGVTVENAVIPAKKNSVKLKLTIPESARSARHEISITGSANIGESRVVRPVRVRHRGHDSFGRAAHSPFRDVIALTIRHKPVFRLYCEEAYQYAHRGTVYPYRMTLERFGDFREPITIQRGDRQNRDLDGIEFVQTTIAPEDSEFMMPIYLPETMHINIQSQSQLYTQAFASFTDSHGTQQHVLVVSEKRNMLRTMPTVVKLSAADPEITAAPGETVTARLELNRTSNMRNAMTLEVLHDSEIRVTPVSISAGSRAVDVPLKIPARAVPMKHRLVFRATGALDAKPDHMAVSEATVSVRVLSRDP